MKKFLIIFFLFILLVKFAVSSDDQLQILRWDSELSFSSFGDTEVNNLFIANNQQNNNISNNQNNNSGASINEIKSEKSNNSNINETREEEQHILTTIEPRSNQLSKNETLFDIKIEVDKKSKEVSPGRSLLSIVKLLNLGNPGRVGTNLNYKIIDQSNVPVYEENETIFVETQREFIKRFPINSGLNEGTYKLVAYLTYSGQVEPAYSEDTFFIKKSKIKFNYLSLIIPTIIALVTISFLTYRRFKKQTFI